jgi:DNA-binding transcriptional MerR regulator
MREEKTYTIGELAEAAGVTPRTIRYYTAEGLLPRPDSRGQYALYGEEHLLRLQLIARLKEAYLPLSEIRARLDQLDTEQLRALLAADQDAAEPAPASAAEYVSQVLGRQAPQALAESAARYHVRDEPRPLPGFQVPVARHEPDRGPVPPPAPSAPPYGFVAPAPTPPQEPLAASAGPPQGAGLLRKLIPQRRERTATAAGAQPEEAWRRVSLAPGVELHVREPAPAGLRERVDQLIAYARELFKESEER